MTIEINGPDIDGFSVLVDGETLLECLSRTDVDRLTIGEINRLLQIGF